jgi:hypothetical protein
MSATIGREPWRRHELSRATLGADPQSGPDQNLQRERLTVYQRDIELTERFARGNPDVIVSAREKLMVCTVSVRIFIYTFPESG